MLLRTLAVGQLKTNCYLLADERDGRAFVVDPGGDLDLILANIQEVGVRLEKIVLTHFHFDHVLAAAPLRRETGAPLAIHHSEAEHLFDPPALFRFFAPNTPKGIRADELLHDGDVLKLGDLSLQVMHTPGHSPGGISLWVASEKVVFCGDTLFRYGVGRTDFPGSSAETLKRSIRRKLFSLPDETVVYPGHGPDTTIGEERRHNPWVATGDPRVGR